MATPAEWQSTHRKDRRKRGLCGYNGCEEQTGERYYCARHAAKHAKRMKTSRRSQVVPA